ncbi:ComEC/Rec2 family competence protein [Conexibacter woesei]|uniref:Metallo-beta-lactamase domain-containing protein n=1 Tax=Conexibacter woesei (strain DSM 14684 / CCUG 47730 / CIP 108061 / JCM 11494 / NBRC 100937 / ID131577) TaxID=469383 RepID=D3F679_CONWI|nr:hypothetical protein [Conexibacter woesei]ADB48752.1 hypothetical protein Cwoe_0316 [Conexibacter woesei DSM 14684]
MWHDGLNVAFLNVEQGDSTLVRLHGDRSWAALVDGGYARYYARHHDWVATHAPHVNLLVGTHCDADHLEGLCSLLDSPDCPRVDLALVPPFLHPTGNLIEAPQLDGPAAGYSAFASDHLILGGLRSCLRSLDALIGETGLSRAIRDGLPHAIDAIGARVEEFDGLPLPELWPTEEPRLAQAVAATGATTATAPADVLDDERLLRTEQACFEAGLPALSDLVEATRRLAQHPLAAQVAQQAQRQRGIEGALVRGALEFSADAVTATTLDRLIRLLRGRGIPIHTGPAPARAQPQGTPVETWHLAPVGGYVAQLRHALPVVKEAFAQLYTDPGLPSNVNRLSHVVAFRSRQAMSAGQRFGVLLSGDSGFQRARGRSHESLSEGWEQVLDWARLVHVPHHGGTSGHFGSRLSMALSDRPGPLDLYLSVGFPNTGSLPHRGFSRLLDALVARGAEPLTLHMSAVPRPAALGSPWRDRVEPAAAVTPGAPGADRIVLCQCTGGWGPLSRDPRHISVSSA